MPMTGPNIPLAWFIDLEYWPWWKALLVWGALSLPVVLLGIRSLAGLGPVRRHVAVGVRLLLLLLVVLLLAGARITREHKSLDLMVLRDISPSTDYFTGYSGRSLNDAIDAFLRKAGAPERKVHREDRVGVISFDATPLIDAMPSHVLQLDARSIRDKTTGTDIASAIRMALATFNRDAMRRILLISDGNQTSGDLDAALAAAASQGVPIDVLKLTYSVRNEVLVEKIVSPSWKKEGEPFDVHVTLRSTNTEPVKGRVTVYEDGKPLPGMPVAVTVRGGRIGADGRPEDGKEVVSVRVPAVQSRGVRSFKAVFEPDPEFANPRSAVSSAAGAAGGGGKPGDTLPENNSASGFTFVQGQGRILYVDNARGDNGLTLLKVLGRKEQVERVSIGQVPEDLVQLQNYDAVILNNVPLGRSHEGSEGLSIRHDEALASYVHDFGGGLVMLGGPSAFGAGGWQGSKTAAVLPVELDVPAKRQMPKGALVLIIHSCEMPDGNYWGEQCAIKAIETLSAQDDVGVIAYDHGVIGRGGAAGGIGGASWVYPLSRKGDGSSVVAAVKRMQVGDMPSFDDSFTLAVKGVPGGPSLVNNNAASKHIIVISDGDPTKPAQALIDLMKQNKITASTVSVYPHQGFVPTTMQEIAKETGGKFYGPVESNPSRLPQIFIKEATVVRRTLIQESSEPPIAVNVITTASKVTQGIWDRAGQSPLTPPPIFGMVLTSPKRAPNIEMPLMTLHNKEEDPLLAHWQAGLGKVAVFTSDAASTWMANWLSDAQRQAAYGKLFNQMVEWVSRPPMSRDFTVTTTREGNKGKLTVEATTAEGGYAGAMTIAGKVLNPDGSQSDVRLVQTRPGIYTAEFPVNAEGNYVVAMSYAQPGQPGQEAKTGYLVSGLAVNDSPETRELRSDDQLLQGIADRTGGRVFSDLDPAAVDLFSRLNIRRSSSPRPAWGILLPLLLGLLIADVAVRRIAWDYNSVKRMAVAAADFVRSFTTTRKVEARPTLDALRRVRDEVAETRLKAGGEGGAGAPPPLPTGQQQRSVKFEARAGAAPEGDLTAVVGGATDKPLPSAPRDPKPKGSQPAASGPGAHTGSLLEAKRRAQQQIKQKEQGEG